MIIGISGSVGSGKTSVSKLLGEKLDYEVIHLNDLAKRFKLEDVSELQTFDFDLDELLKDVEEKLRKFRFENKCVILEGHFAHFIDSSLVDYLFVVGRDLKDLKEEYSKRGYNEQKIADNLEVESFNLCFYEAIENGFVEEEQVFRVENDLYIGSVVDSIMRKVA